MQALKPEGVTQKHPRLRGEDSLREAVLRYAPETPPLTRGRLGPTGTGRASWRNTPAYAGKTHAVPLSILKNEKHPRLRGEDLIRPLVAKATSETPPLTRGRRRWTAVCRPPQGNTPAYAGKTVRRLDREGHAAETPPLTRGRRGDDVPRIGPLGNTPAYAGKTNSRSSRSSTETETPPLTRGRRIADSFFNSPHGNTPAYAGKTSPSNERHQTFWETPPLTRGRPHDDHVGVRPVRKHPRLRGEDRLPGEAGSRKSETPPLTRGRRREEGGRHKHHGNTPAYAGKTNRSNSRL